MTIETRRHRFDLLSGRFLEARLPLLLATLALLCISLVTIYAIGHPHTDAPQVADSPAVGDERIEPQQSRYAGFWLKQALFAAAGLSCLVAVNLVDYRRIGPYSYAIYAGILGLLVVLLLDKYIDLPFVPVVNSARRWIRITVMGRDVVNIQPSEFCKVGFILALAWYLRFRENYRMFKGLVGPFAITLLAIVLIMRQPDLGTVMLLMPILFTMLFVAGARVKHLLLIIGMALLSAPILWQFMHPYQRMRISSVALQNERVFAAAQSRPRLAAYLVGDTDKLRTWRRDEGYHLIHSKQAIASGGIRGYGLGRGPYLRYDYLPERHNDFIFAAIAHQFGLVGCVVVLLLYGVIIAAAMEIAWLNTDAFGRLVAAGIGAMFAVEVLVNVNMTMGLMPITGLTLPLVSYGGSSMVVHLIAVGLLNNIGRERPFSLAKKPFEFEN